MGIDPQHHGGLPRVGDPDLVIRLAEPDDLAAVYEIDKAVFGEMAYSYFALRQLFDVHKPCLLVAEEAAALRGYALAVPATGADYGWILGVAVSPDFRRRGCGQMLTERGLELLAGLGLPEARLTVEPDNAAAIALYAGAGFGVIERAADYFGPGEDRLVMAAKLVPR